MPANFESLLKFARLKNYHVEMHESGWIIGWPCENPRGLAWLVEGIQGAFELVGWR